MKDYRLFSIDDFVSHFVKMGHVTCDLYLLCSFILGSSAVQFFAFIGNTVCCEQHLHPLYVCGEGFCLRLKFSYTANDKPFPENVTTRTCGGGEEIVAALLHPPMEITAVWLDSPTEIVGKNKNKAGNPMHLHRHLWHRNQQICSEGSPSHFPDLLPPQNSK